MAEDQRRLEAYARPEKPSVPERDELQSQLAEAERERALSESRLRRINELKDEVDRLEDDVEREMWAKADFLEQAEAAEKERDELKEQLHLAIATNRRMLDSNA